MSQTQGLSQTAIAEPRGTDAASVTSAIRIPAPRHADSSEFILPAPVPQQAEPIPAGLPRKGRLGSAWRAIVPHLRPQWAPGPEFADARAASFQDFRTERTRAQARIFLSVR